MSSTTPRAIEIATSIRSTGSPWWPASSPPAIVLGLSSDDLILGEASRRFVEDDEYLIRRRLHCDLAARD